MRCVGGIFNPRRESVERQQPGRQWIRKYRCGVRAPQVNQTGGRDSAERGSSAAAAAREFPPVKPAAQCVRPPAVAATLR